MAWCPITPRWTTCFAVAGGGRCGILVTLALVVLVVAFVVQNSQLVTVHFWFFTHKVHLIWLVLACLVAGTVLGYVLGVPGRRAMRRRRKDEKAARRPT